MPPMRQPPPEPTRIGSKSWSCPAPRAKPSRCSGRRQCLFQRRHCQCYGAQSCRYHRRYAERDCKPAVWRWWSVELCHPRHLFNSTFPRTRASQSPSISTEGIKQTQLFETVPLFDTERVEVLSGPQGTLYGKDATAGAVNIISKQPGFDAEGYLTAGYGNFDTRRFEGAVQYALVGDVLAGRLAVTYLKDDGVFENLTKGLGNTSQTDIAAARLSLLFRPSDQFQTILRLVDTKDGRTQLHAAPDRY